MDIKARNPERGRTVAIKVLPEATFRTAEFREKLIAKRTSSPL